MNYLCVIQFAGVKSSLGTFGTKESTMKVRAFKPYNAKLFSSLSEDQLNRFRRQDLQTSAFIIFMLCPCCSHL